MRVLVTGSSGFLGRHVADHLSGLVGYEVAGYDLRPMHSDRYLSTVGDLCDLEAVVGAVCDADVVVHFGGIGDVDVATEHPSLAAAANVVGTMNVALAAQQAAARVVYASTWEVYGTPRYDPVDEQHLCDPGHVYGATKLGGEQMLSALHQSGELPTAILRLGTAYGPGMRPNAVFSRFADAARAGAPITVHGSGRQWRQFTHTSDVVRAVQLAIESDLDELTVNVVTDEVVTIRELAEIVASRYGVPVEFGPERHGDPPSSIISSERAASLLGWRAQVAFQEGLAALLRETDAAAEPLTAVRGR